MLKYTNENIFIPCVRATYQSLFLNIEIPKNFATCFYLAELNEAFLGRAKNELYYLCIEIPL